MPQRLVIDLATGEQIMVDPTPEELADRAQMAASAAAASAAAEARAGQLRTAREQLRTKAKTDANLRAVALAMGLDPDVDGG